MKRYRATRLQRLVDLVSKLSAMSSKELWKDDKVNFKLFDHWCKKERHLRTLIFNEYEQ